MKCALRVTGEMEHADEFHVTLGTSCEEVYAIFHRHAEKPFHFLLYRNFVTHAEGDYEFGSSCSMAADFTLGHTRNLCVSLDRENCVLAMKQADGGDSTVATTQRQGCMLPQDFVA